MAGRAKTLERIKPMRAAALQWDVTISCKVNEFSIGKNLGDECVLVSTGLGGKVELSRIVVACCDDTPGPRAWFSTPSNSDSFEKEVGENNNEMG